MIHLSEIEIAWLAGLLEGEGSFVASKNYPVCVSLCMTDKDVVETVATWWNVSISEPKKQRTWHKQSYRCMIRGKHAIECMTKIYSLMGDRRTKQIDKAINSYQPKGRCQKITIKQATEIKTRFENGERSLLLAEEYGVSRWTVYAIKQGRRAVIK